MGHRSIVGPTLAVGLGHVAVGLEHVAVGLGHVALGLEHVTVGLDCFAIYDPLLFKSL